MNRLTRSSILLLVVLFLSACRSQIPKELPGDLEVRLESSVLLPDGSPKWWFRFIAISGNQMKVEFSQCPEVKIITLEDRTRESLYRSIAKSEFDLIGDGSAPAGDDGRGFQAIYLKAGNVSKNVKYERERFPLSETDRKRFNEIWSPVVDIANGDVGFPCRK